MGEIVRLQKYIAMSGVASRRAAETMIQEGRVKVNGKKITEQGVKIEIGADNVSVDDKPIKLKNKKYYIMLNKPVGYVSTAKDQFDRPTVVDLIKEDLGDRRIFPVGRLDKDTEGLLLITNDGELAHNLLAPKKHVDKTYYARAAGRIKEEAIKLFADGLHVDDEFTALPAKLELKGYNDKDNYTDVIITIHEGKFHQIKRMFEAVGSEVLYLKRLRMGSLVLDETLKPGEYRTLTQKEIDELYNCN